MTAPPGVAPVPTIRRTTSAEAQGQTEELIRAGQALLSFWGIEMSHSRLVKHVRRFQREVRGFSWFDYFATAVQVDEDARRQARAARADGRLWYRDPTGDEGVRRAMGGEPR